MPNGVFAPYTGINTNLLFFTKGTPTKEVWYYEHQLPEGYKNYTKTRPIRIEHFEREKAWWDDREENEYAWKVPVEEIKASGLQPRHQEPARDGRGPRRSGGTAGEVPATAGRDRRDPQRAEAGAGGGVGRGRGMSRT